MPAPTSLLASTLRLGLGARVTALGPRPTEPLVLYDFEGCPYCRKVREAISMLDLVVDIRPCPKRGTRFRPALGTIAPRVRVPTLIDPGAPSERRILQESDAIVQHLFARFGAGPPPGRARLGWFGTWTSSLATAARIHRGTWPRPSKATATTADYQLFSFEASGEARLVREVMTELEIPYRLVSCAAGSARRLQTETIPTLRSGDGALELLGAAAIVAHLEREYAA